MSGPQTPFDFSSSFVSSLNSGTFSSALFCFPFSTSPSDAMLVNVRSFGLAISYSDTVLAVAWNRPALDPCARLILRDRAWKKLERKKHQGLGTEFITIWIIISVLIISSFWLIQVSYSLRRFNYIVIIVIFSHSEKQLIYWVKLALCVRNILDDNIIIIQYNYD